MHKNFYLVISRGPFARQKFLLGRGKNLIGREDSESRDYPLVDLEPYDVDAKVSRRHAMIEVKKDSVTIRDLGSLNGTFRFDGSQIESERDYLLSVGEELIIAQVWLRLEEESA